MNISRKQFEKVPLSQPILFINQIMTAGWLEAKYAKGIFALWKIHFWILKLSGFAN